MPLLINIILFIGLFFLLRHGVRAFNLWFDHYLPTWLHWLTTLFWLLFFISFMLIFIFAFVTVTNIIAAPFNSFLAEKVEFYLTGQFPDARSLLDNIKDAPRIIARQLGILGYYLAWAIPLCLLFFIPLIQIIAPLLWFCFHAWYLTLTYIDYPTDNHRIPLKEVKRWLQYQRSIALSFGIFSLIATMLPVINFFVIPASVAGATQFWLAENSR